MRVQNTVGVNGDGEGVRDREGVVPNLNLCSTLSGAQTQGKANTGPGGSTEIIGRASRRQRVRVKGQSDGLVVVVPGGHSDACVDDAPITSCFGRAVCHGGQKNAGN